MASSVSSRAPVIGLTTYLERAQTGVWDVPASFLPEVYFDSVTRSGGIAVLLPPQPVSEQIVSRVLDGLDGLILTGGKDVDPARYGQVPHPTTDEPRPDRDAWEDSLVRGAIDRGLPFLGICRGAQVLNVALGGTLIQHLPDVVGSTRYQLGGGDFNEVEVEVEAGSELADLVGAGVTAKVYHHQSIDRVADDLTVSARTDDGVIQAVELDSVPFGPRGAVAPRGDPGRPSALRRPWSRRRGPTVASSSAGSGSAGSTTLINPADESCSAPSSTPRSRAWMTRSRARCRPSGAGRGSPPSSARTRCAGSPPSSRARSRSSPGSRCATRGIRSARRAGRPATSATCSTTTRPPRSG